MHIEQKRHYSVKALKEINNANIDPNFITGFSDGESTFSFTISKRDSGSKLTWVINPSFSIELDKKDTVLLKKIQSYFKVGKLKTRTNRNEQITFSVNSVKELQEVIIPHFTKYPLLTKKRIDFELFKQAVELLAEKKHLTDEGLKEIFSIRSSLGKGLSEKLINIYPDITPKEIVTIDTLNIYNDYWLAGFTDAEGCFECVVRKHPTVKIGYQVSIRFTLIQHSRDFMLINSIKDHLKCGTVREDLKKPYVTWVVADLSDIINIIIPFFDKFAISGNKLSDYEYFRKIAFLIKDKHHLTQEGFTEILDLKSKMNSKKS